MFSTKQRRASARRKLNVARLLFLMRNPRTGPARLATITADQLLTWARDPDGHQKIAKAVAETMKVVLAPAEPKGIRRHCYMCDNNRAGVQAVVMTNGVKMSMCPGCRRLRKQEIIEGAV